MKSLLQKLTAGTALACAFAFAIPEASATDITLDGYGYYSRSNSMRYFGKNGKKQSGRYNYLGADYYRSTRIGMDFLTNRSQNKSGSLSFEFWAMPYYGATTGIVLMTVGTNPMPGGRSKRNFSVQKFGVSLETKRYPELSIWEYTRDGWDFRDALSFSRKSWL